MNEFPQGTPAEVRYPLPAITWQRTADTRTWCAAVADVLLTVTHLSSGAWIATVAGPFTDDRSPELGTRVAAQTWAERTAGVNW